MPSPNPHSLPLHQIRPPSPPNLIRSPPSPNCPYPNPNPNPSSSSFNSTSPPPRVEPATRSLSTPSTSSSSQVPADATSGHEAWRESIGEGDLEATTHFDSTSDDVTGHHDPPA
uniref:vegetative cell wall protein gp1-like n=1 Tax=Fragaria vesca subsp. vesca TaxID=101020 RepID=UPI0005CA92D5|nr:PREDICTED: vegetative cell wall protein gp1-like [Fragaria vesca subsp. vesca]